jgi:transglutaminase-like putative cysteine protease
MAKPRKPPSPNAPEPGQILALTLVVLGTYLPLAFRLHWQVSAFVALAATLRLAALRWPRALPGTLGLAVLTLAGGLNCLLAYRTLAGRDGGSALFVTMLALKLLELKGRRDLRVTGTILWFLIAIQFLFDRSAWLAVYLGVAAVLGLAVQADLEGALGPKRIRAALGLSTRLVLQALPLTLVLFLLFPRLDAPLWNLGLDPGRGTTGMGDRLEPGRIGELVLSGELAFRARFEGRPPPPSELYWRGLVLWLPDRLGWSPGRPPEPDDWDEGPGLAQAARPIAYEVLAEASGRAWLFALDLPRSAPPGARLGQDFALVAQQPLTKPRRFRLESALAYRTPDPSPELRDYALKVPANVTERMRRLAAGWRESPGGDWGRVQAALELFHREPFHYTLLPPPLGASPTDEFLFETRAGFCEHYAGAFAILMRLAGVPSRVVLGYLGGERGRLGGYYSVWQSDAHAWVEVAIPGRGWVRVDPTAAVDPARIDNRGAERLLGGAGAPLRFDLGEGGALGQLLHQARLLADGMDAAWQAWVLDFSSEEQRSFLDRLGLAEYREAGLAVLMIVAGGLAMGLLLVGLLGQGTGSDPVLARYRELSRRLARVGLARGPGEGPTDYGRRVAAARPDLAGPVGRFIELYVSARYSTGAPVEALGRLDSFLKEVRPRRLPGPRGRPTAGAESRE